MLFLQAIILLSSPFLVFLILFLDDGKFDVLLLPVSLDDFVSKKITNKLLQQIQVGVFCRLYTHTRSHAQLMLYLLQL